MSETAAGDSEYDIAFKRYQILLDFFRHKLDVILRNNALYQVFTGVIVFYVLISGRESTIRFLLLFPIAIGLGLILQAHLSIPEMIKGESEFDRLKEKLKSESFSETVNVTGVLRWSRILLLLVVVVLSILVSLPAIKTFIQCLIHSIRG